MSDTHKFLSKQELELQEIKNIYSLRAERDKLQEQLNTAKKALIEISEMADSGDITWNENIKAVTNPALAAIGGEDD